MAPVVMWLCKLCRQQLGCGIAEAFLRLTVSASAMAGPGELSGAPGETYRSTAEVFPVELKDAQLEAPRLAVSGFLQVRLPCRLWHPWYLGGLVGFGLKP